MDYFIITKLLERFKTQFTCLEADTKESYLYSFNSKRSYKN